MENHKNNLAENLLKDILAKAAKPVALFEKLFSIWREEAAKKDKILPRLIFDLIAKQKIDICLLAARAIDEGAKCFSVFFVMRDVIPLLTKNGTSLISLLEKFHSGMQDDLAVFQQYLPIEQLARNQPDFCRQLLDIFLPIQKPFITGYISAIFVILSESNLEGIYSELLSLSNHESIYVTQSAINALSRLPYQLPADQKKIDNFIQVLKTFSDRNSVGLDIAIVGAIGNSLRKSEEAKNILLAYVQKDNPEILYQVSNALFQNCKIFIQEKWFKDCLMALSRTSCSYRGIIHNLDLILFTILEDKKECAVVQDFFIQWALNSYFSATSKDRVGAFFPSVIHQLIRDKQFLETFITKLINHDDFKVHHFLFDFTHELSVYNIKDLKLDRKMVDNLNFDDLLYICRKILGYIILDGILFQ